jgi:ketosteroid isomerase-like protein
MYKILITVLALIFVLFVGCAKSNQAVMTPQEQDAAKKELTEAINTIIEGLEKMDAEALFQSYWNAHDFVLFTTDGLMIDYQAAKEHHVGWFTSLSSLKVTTVAEEFRFLPGNATVCAWRATFDLKPKAGGEQKMDLAITLVFNKIDNHWKVVYQQTW